MTKSSYVSGIFYDLEHSRYIQSIIQYSYSMVRLVWCDKYQEEVIRLSTKFFVQELELGD